MPPADTKVVQLFPARSAQAGPPDWRRREMGRDIASLQDLSQRLQQMRAPLRQASQAFLAVSRNKVGPQAEQKLGDLDTLLGALDGSMKQLIDAMTVHQDSLRQDARIHG